jgi:DNA-binding transcriptional ArsR family regulator
LSAVADPSRRALLQRLALGEATTGQLAELLPMSRPAVSQHLKVLQEAGLVVSRARGRHRWHALAVEPLHLIRDWAATLAARHPDSARPTEQARTADLAEEEP